MPSTINKMYFTLLILLFSIPLSVSSTVDWDSEMDPDAYFDAMGSSLPQIPESESSDVTRAENFGAGGFLTAVGAGEDRIRASLLQTNGKTLAAGVSHNGSNLDFAWVQYNPDGELDTSFHTDGKAVDTVGSGDDWIHSFVLQTDGRYVAAGRANFYNIDFAIARYFSDGRLDTSFHTDGKNSTAVRDNTDIARAVSIGTDGKIVVAGYSWWFGRFNYAVARYSTNGAIDTTFGTNGTIVTLLSSGDSGALSILTVDDKVITAGPTHNGNDWDFSIIRYRSDGSLDTSFSTEGHDTLAILGADDKNFAIAIDTLGLITLAGSTDNGSNLDFAACRYDSNGALDTAFDMDGKVSHSITNNRADVARAIRPQSDSKMVLAGYTHNGSNNDFALLRYLSNGGLDTTFHTDGKNSFAISANEDTANGLSIVGDDNVIVSTGQSNNGANLDFSVARLNTDGSLAASGDLDVSFGIRGKRFVDLLGGTEIGRTGVLQADGKMFIVGLDGTVDIAIIRLTLFGDMDTSFHTDGQQSYDFTGTDWGLAAFLTTANELVAGGLDGNNDLAILRILSDGGLDTAFHTDGKNSTATVNTDIIWGLVMTTDGRAVAGARGQNKTVVARYLTSGGLDTSFNTAGFIATSISGGDRGMDIALLSDGQYAVGGWSTGADTDFAVFRYKTEGVLDTAFHTDGVAVTPVGSVDEGNGICVDSQGRLLLAGSADGTDTDFAVVRYLTDGGLDTSFNTDGKWSADPGNVDILWDVEVAAGGKIITSGILANDFAVVRLTDSGSLDTSFGTDSVATTGFTGNDKGYKLLSRPNGKFCVVGSANANADFGAVCYWP